MRKIRLTVCAVLVMALSSLSFPRAIHAELTPKEKQYILITVVTIHAALGIASDNIPGYLTTWLHLASGTPQTDDPSSVPPGADPDDPTSIIEALIERYGTESSLNNPFYKFDALYGITPDGGIIPVYNPSDDDETLNSRLITAIVEDVTEAGDGLGGFNFDGQGEDATWYIVHYATKTPPPGSGNDGDADSTSDANDAGLLIYIGEGSDFIHPKAQGLVMAFSSDEVRSL